MVIVTGASRGIGKALTEKVLMSDQMCCAVVRDADHFSQTCSKVGTPNLYVVDYRLKSFIDALPSISQAGLSHVTLILNAFDILPIKKASDLSEEEISININFNIIKQIEIVLKALKFSKHLNAQLRVVSLDSGAAYQPISGWSMYCAGKAYLGMFLRVLSQENGVPLVLYDPGVVDTEMQREIRNSSKKDFPLVEMFIEYQTSQKLHSAAAVANDIWWRYLQEWKADELQEHFGSKL